MTRRYGGMTVNERLYVSGLMDNFDIAVKNQNVVEIKSILEKVELTESPIMPILKQLNLGGGGEAES